MLTGKYGEDSKLIYDLADQGGELCSLRYDLTVPFVRYVAMSGLSSFKMYQIGKVHRRDNPSNGRFREFYQCDFDIAGQFEKMGPDFEVPRILTELLNELQIGDYEVDVKGLKEETDDAIGAFVSKTGSPLDLLLELKKEGSKFLENAESSVALNELEILFKALDKSNCIQKMVFDLSLARGLDYYTGVIFEAVFKGSTQAKHSTETDVLVSILGDDLSLGAELVSKLWDADIKAELMVDPREVKHSTPLAGIPWRVVMGEKGQNIKLVKLKHDKPEENSSFLSRSLKK